MRGYQCARREPVIQVKKLSRRKTKITLMLKDLVYDSDCKLFLFLFGGVLNSGLITVTVSYSLRSVSAKSKALKADGLD